MKKVLIKIEGMTCAGCSSGLEKHLNSQKGIIKAEVNLVMGNASIEYNDQEIDLNKINEYVSQKGFKSLGIDTFELEKRNVKKEKTNLWITIVVGLMVMYLSMGHIIKLPEISFLSKTSNPKLYSVVLCILSTIVIGLSFDRIKNGEGFATVLAYKI